MTEGLIYQPFGGLEGADILLERYQSLTKELQKYLDSEAVEKIKACAVYGAQAHNGQKRKTGEPFFIHPLAVCAILARQRFDVPVLQAALLHDVLEDTPVSKNDMVKAFGGEVTRMVDGVSKLDQLRDKGVHIMQAESFRKLLLAIADDPRVLIIKLADRLHNMLTLGSFRREKQRRIAKETLDVYASIAGRLGLFYFRTQLEDLAFSYLYPRRYEVLKKYYRQYLANNHDVEPLQGEIMPLLEEYGIKATFNRRERHLWGLYQRMKRKKNQHLSTGKKQGFQDACRATLVRIITDSEDNCYRILGLVHRLCRPVEHKFSDYIAAPKSNGYRSLHTSVVSAENKVLSVQIRTRDMHTLSEMGIISVWHQYNNNRAGDIDEEHNVVAEKTLRSWLSRLKEVQGIIDDPIEFYTTIKNELQLSNNCIYVYTPTGKVIDLPCHATPVDFAYAICSDLGHHCAGAEINGRPYPIYQPLEQGQTVRIVRSDNPQVHAGWQQFVVSATAAKEIKSFLHKMADDQAQILGENLLNGALQRLGHEAVHADSPELQNYLQNNNLTASELWRAIGRGGRQAFLVASSILGHNVNISARNDLRILEVNSAMDSGINMAECCYPLPHERILGQMVAGKGITIHRESCSYSQVASRDEVILAAWAENTMGLFRAKIQLQSGERRGLLSEISTAISKAGIDILDLHPGTCYHDGKPREMTFVIAVRNIEHFNEIAAQLATIPAIQSVTRPN